MNLRNILFDLDGTLSDSAPGILRSHRYALTQLGQTVPADEVLRDYIGPSLQMTYGALFDAPTAAAAIKLFRHDYVENGGMFENSLFPAIPSVLSQLQAEGYRLFVATAKVETIACRIIEHFQLTPFFTAVHGSELDGTRADKTDLIAHVLAQHHLPPNETVMIGDRTYDIAGAKNNGVAAIGVLWGFGSRAELTAAGADAIIGHTTELPSALAELSSIDK